jgi:hypothetical protein
MEQGFLRRSLADLLFHLGEKLREVILLQTP